MFEQLNVNVLVAILAGVLFAPVVVVVWASSETGHNRLGLSAAAVRTLTVGTWVGLVTAIATMPPASPLRRGPAALHLLWWGIGGVGAAALLSSGRALWQLISVVTGGATTCTATGDPVTAPFSGQDSALCRWRLERDVSAEDSDPPAFDMIATGTLANRLRVNGHGPVRVQTVLPGNTRSDRHQSEWDGTPQDVQRRLQESATDTAGELDMDGQDTHKGIEWRAAPGDTVTLLRADEAVLYLGTESEARRTLIRVFLLRVLGGSALALIGATQVLTTAHMPV